MRQPTILHWRTGDLKYLPDNGNRYEIINGELFVTRAPHWRHQKVSGRINTELDLWSRISQLGEPIINPGVIFTEADSVIPDVVWISYERLESAVDESGHLTVSPELVIEVLSLSNESVDRQNKLNLYSTQSVDEYWIVDWRVQQIEIYRRQGGALQLAIILIATDTLSSPLLPGFACPVNQLFA
jgi:Uma2 family endonuclease